MGEFPQQIFGIILTAATFGLWWWAITRKETEPERPIALKQYPQNNGAIVLWVALWWGLFLVGLLLIGLVGK